MSKDVIITEGNTYEEALNLGLEQLKLDPQNVDVEILKEKKASIFRKAYIQLKITKKEEMPDDTNKDIAQVERKENLSIVENEKFFKLDYLPDGVYITILRSDMDNITRQMKTITDYLTKKSVKNYDLAIISKCLQDGTTTSFKIAPYQEEKKNRF